MIQQIKKKKQLILVSLVSITIIYSHKFVTNTSLLSSSSSTFSLVVKPSCNCSAFETQHILIERTDQNEAHYVISIIHESTASFHDQNNNTSANNSKAGGSGRRRRIKTNLFNLTIHQLGQLNFTCDLYNVLRRGLRQHVLAYSLYGTKPRYSRNLAQIVELMRLKYAGYTMRVYYDSTINSSIRCTFECKYADIMDFCNMNKFYYTNLSDFLLNQEQAGSAQLLMNMTYMHKMMWRILPVGDSFVDVFMARDTDSFISDREIDAVNEWLRSNNSVAHIMRDSESHDFEIMGGMWGMRNSLNRSLASDIFTMLMNVDLCRFFNQNGKSPKGQDQQFLTYYVYDLIVWQATVHDSYWCEKYANSRPFPTRRVAMDFVGSAKKKLNATRFVKECPRACRPRKHPDWIYC